MKPYSGCRAADQAAFAAAITSKARMRCSNPPVCASGTCSPGAEHVAEAQAPVVADQRLVARADDHPVRAASAMQYR